MSEQPFPTRIDAGTDPHGDHLHMNVYAYKGGGVSICVCGTKDGIPGSKLLTSTAFTLEQWRRFTQDVDQVITKALVEHPDAHGAPFAEDELVCAATKRCPCGAGVAYPKMGRAILAWRDCWDCSAILKGEAVPSGQPGSVTHTDKLPFAFWSIRAENESDNEPTTRPVPAATKKKETPDVG